MIIYLIITLLPFIGYYSYIVYLETLYNSYEICISKEIYEHMFDDIDKLILVK